MQVAEQMIRAIENEVRMTRHYIEKETLDGKVLHAMRTVPRHAFIPDAPISLAYENRPLYIGHGQTISQPYIVALMTDLLQTRDDHIILEVGTGSGYQTAVLSLLVKHVYSIETLKSLADSAQQRLFALGYNNVSIRNNDGYHGWPEFAPFDGIIVTAATPTIPPPLIAQLKKGGRMIVPVGESFGAQSLVLVEKNFDGSLHTRDIIDVAFVPLTGNHDHKPL